MVALAVLLMRRSALGLTVKVAVTAKVFVPSVVDKEPAGIVFAAVRVPVTTTDAEQDPLGGMTVPSLTIKPPRIAVTVPGAHVVVASGDAALLIPVG